MNPSTLSIDTVKFRYGDNKSKNKLQDNILNIEHLKQEWKGVSKDR